jgi:hypothetical protein
MIDYGDDPYTVHDAADFRWKLYFKRSCVDRASESVLAYGNLPVLPIAYCVLNDMATPPEGYDGSRPISVACLFEDSVLDGDVFRRVRGRLLTFAKGLNAKYKYPMQIGTISEPGPVGRSAINAQYKKCLYSSKIVLNANPDHWEGDARTWEALSSGALVFVDRMCQPAPHPLIDGTHVIFYDNTAEGIAELEAKVLYFLEHDSEREKIGRQGREFVLAYHRSIHRVSQIIDELDTLEADRLEQEMLSRTRYQPFP